MDRRILHRDGLSRFLTKEIKDIVANLAAIDYQAIKNIGIEDYKQQYVKKYRLSMPDIHFESKNLDVRKEVDSTKSKIGNKRVSKPIYKRCFYVYLPISGRISKVNNIPVIEFKGTGYYGPEIKLFVDNGELYFKVNATGLNIDDGDEIDKHIKKRLTNIIASYGILKGEIDSHNLKIEEVVDSCLERAKLDDDRLKKILSKVSVPLRYSRSEVSATVKQRSKIVIPDNQENALSEPSISIEVYNQICDTINVACQNIERYPSLYKEQREENLRDFILFLLDPSFRLGAVSGETFNKGGRADILMEYRSTVIFVAECKYWSGKVGMLKTVDQLLRYLTWRNSHSAIIFFVKNKSMVNAISTLKDDVKEHSSFVRFDKEISDSVFRYKFSLPSDFQKELYLTFMFYHTPKD